MFHIKRFVYIYIGLIDFYFGIADKVDCKAHNASFLDEDFTHALCQGTSHPTYIRIFIEVLSDVAEEAIFNSWRFFVLVFPQHRGTRTGVCYLFSQLESVCITWYSHLLKWTAAIVHSVGLWNHCVHIRDAHDKNRKITFINLVICNQPKHFCLINY